MINWAMWVVEHVDKWFFLQVPVFENRCAWQSFASFPWQHRRNMFCLYISGLSYGKSEGVWLHSSVGHENLSAKALLVLAIPSSHFSLDMDMDDTCAWPLKKWVASHMTCKIFGAFLYLVCYSSNNVLLVTIGRIWWNAPTHRNNNFLELPCVHKKSLTIHN
jgi:hypothetical protein